MSRPTWTFSKKVRDVVEPLSVKQIAYENANTGCQASKRPYRMKGDIDESMKICSDIEPPGSSVKDMFIPKEKLRLRGEKWHKAF